MKRRNLYRIKNIPKYANVAKKITLCPKYKAFGENPTLHVTDYHSSYFQSWWYLNHVMGMLVIGKE
jgi:hypothetical protein